ncbi:MAG: sensor histidine kinase [Cellulosilyticaceae bacterium]
MSLRKFLKDRWLFCLFQMLTVLFVAALLAVFHVNLYGILFVCMGMVLLQGGALLSDYLSKRHYYNRLQEVLENLDQKRLVSELIDEPEFEEGKIWWEALRLMGKSMNDEVARYRLLQEEYKDYIETWIHEIKMPLACTALMCENNKSELTSKILVENNKVEQYVEQALFYARSTSVEKDYMIKEVGLEELVRSAIKKEARQIIETRTTVKLENLEYQVLADVKWVGFILGQILGNSLKYRQGSLSLHIWACDNDSQVILNIEDNGVGIPVQDMGRVWDKGFTGENGRNYAKSTGIGLYLCKKLCKKMNLGINIQSQQGKGTTVQLIFPKDKRVFFEA